MMSQSLFKSLENRFQLLFLKGLEFILPDLIIELVTQLCIKIFD
jgi:hypothetical protein